MRWRTQTQFSYDRSARKRPVACIAAAHAKDRVPIARRQISRQSRAAERRFASGNRDRCGPRSRSASTRYRAELSRSGARNAPDAAALHWPRFRNDHRELRRAADYGLACCSLCQGAATHAGVAARLVLRLCTGQRRSFGAISDAAVRYRIYPVAGLQPSEIGRLVAYLAVAFTLGAPMRWSFCSWSSSSDLSTRVTQRSI